MTDIVKCDRCGYKGNEAAIDGEFLDENNRFAGCYFLCTLSDKNTIKVHWFILPDGAHEYLFDFNKDAYLPWLQEVAEEAVKYYLLQGDTDEDVLYCKNCRSQSLVELL